MILDINFRLKVLCFFFCIASLYGANKKTGLEKGKLMIKTNSSQNEEGVFGVSEEIEIDFSQDIIKAAEGVNLNYQGMKVKAFKVRRDQKENKIYIDDYFISEREDVFGKVKIEAKNGEISVNGDEGTFYNAFGYIDLSKITLAEQPNTRVYFGGDKIEYKNGEIVLRNGRITTDFKVAETSEFTRAGYHFLSESIVIIPDKHITLRNSDFYKGSKDRTPFTFPWYRMNIRGGSEVPLFPKWTTDSYYGWQVSWGVLYGNKDSKYKGGFAPKFADTMGLLIGRWENWYETEKFGTSKLNIDDFLIYSKVKKDLKYTDPLEYEQKNKRYRFNYSHEYDGDYGKFHFNSIYGTQSMIPKLDKLINDYEGRNWFDNPVDAVQTKRPKYDDNIGFYSLDADLTKLGKNKDISLKSVLKLTDNKKSYALMVYDLIDDIDYGSNIDNDLYSHFELYKDNDKYKIGGYYQYLYDMDPGSVRDDNKSRAENFGFEIFEKKYNIGFSYDEKNEDKYRPLEFYERDPNLGSKVTVDSILGTKFRYSYNPTMVREYTKYDSKDLRISLGEYSISDDYTLKGGIDVKEYLRELDLGNDSLRSGRIDSKNLRDIQYNRYENIVYKDFREVTGYLTVYNDEIKIQVSSGETREEFLTREGLYDNTTRKYINDSKFYEVLLEKNMISLKKFGELAISADFRYDKYEKGFNPYLNVYATGEDSTLRSIINANHVVELYNNSNKERRSIDFSLKNDFFITYQKYKYDNGNIKFGSLIKDSGRTASAEEIRLEGKDNYFQIIDNIDMELGNTLTKYTVDYKKATNPAINQNTNNKTIKHSLDFQIDDKRKIYVYYKDDRHFTDERLDDKNYNYLTYDSYGGNYNYGNHTFGYVRNVIKSNLTNMKNIDDAKETIKMDTYTYNYKFSNDDQIILRYTFGNDDRYNRTSGIKELNVSNQSYYVRYIDAGEIERRYTLSYGTYRHREESSKNMLLGGKRYNSSDVDELYLSFEYIDNRLTEKDLESYGKLEYNKNTNELTTNELDRIKNILQDRKNKRNMLNFNIDRIRDEGYSLGDYKKNFRIWVRGERNITRYDRTGDYFRSLQEINGGIFYSYKRVGIGYTVDINNGWQGTKWNKIDREHKISFHAKIGKPSQGWEVKTYGKFYENINERLNANNKKKNALEGMGVEIGKEFGYYQWSVAYENGYNSSVKDYEWKVGLQFKLLAFPTNPIFGVGAEKKSDGKVSPKTYLFDGIKPEKVIEDD
jgi:hypothetical protein